MATTVALEIEFFFEFEDLAAIRIPPRRNHGEGGDGFREMGVDEFIGLQQMEPWLTNALANGDGSNRES